MKVGLIDIDGHNFPNLPLMKLSAHHKLQGDNVDWVNGFERYDRIYMSKVFSFTPNDCTAYNADEIIAGGTGRDLINKLSDETEHTYPDYNLYPNCQNTAYGFLTRGCPNDCSFCIVSKKEGLRADKVSERYLICPNFGADRET